MRNLVNLNLYENITYITALFKPSILSTCENIIRGTLSGSNNSLQMISSGISSNGGCVRIFFGLGSATGSERHRFTRSCESGVKLIGDFQAAKIKKKIYCKKNYNFKISSDSVKNNK